MRIYLSADAKDLRELRAGGSVLGVTHLPHSDDEADEFDAMMAALVPGCAVLAADVESVADPVDLTNVAALHVDLDGSGDLAWFAPQEIDEVIDLVER
ncbi:MAG TPA: hypothetical protein VK948_04890 [Aeromicrobium sp.]|nr:hypothetical protein [Aeromicrobium sp.]